MSATSNIEWTDATWNPVRGCIQVSPGCANCYAKTFAERFRGVPGHPYEQGFDLRLVPEKLREPLTWKTPRRVFVNSMSDLFQDGVPDAYIDCVFAVMALAPQHTFQVLTKRAERMRTYVSARSRDGDELERLRDAIQCAMDDAPRGWTLQGGVLVTLTETKLDRVSMVVSEICLPDQWRVYQRFIARMDRVYYLDPPAPYVALAPHIIVRPLGEMFAEIAYLTGP